MLTLPFTRSIRDSKRKRKQALETRQSVQDRLPLADIQEGVLYLKDGSYRIFVDYPGKNYSIYSAEQMRQEAHDVAFLISSITCRFAIIKYVRSVESQEGLIEIEKALDDARSRALGAHGEVLDKAAFKRLDLIERHILPQALTEAARAEHLSVTNVIAFMFDAKTPIEEAERQVHGFCRISEDRTKVRAERLDTPDVVALLSEWLTPTDILKGASTDSVVLPSQWDGVA